MGDWSAPRTVAEETSYASHITGWYPIACHRLDVTLAPGGSVRACFVLGYGENPKDAKWDADGRVRKDTARRVLAKFADSSTYHQYQPLTKRGNADIGSGFNDDPLWLVAAAEVGATCGRTACRFCERKESHASAGRAGG